MKKNSLLSGCAALLSALALTMMAAACGPLGKYSASTTVNSNIYGRGVDTCGANAGRIGWEKIYTDPQLKALISKALEQNHDIHLAQQNMLLAQNGLKGAKLAFIPSLGITPTATAAFAQGSRPAFGGGVAASLSWEADVFYRLGNRIDMGKASLLQAQDYADAVRVKLVASVASAYYNLLMLDAQKEAVGAMLDTWQKSLDAIHALKKEGFADEVAVRQYEATYAKLQAMALDLDKEIALAENAMSVLLGEPCKDIERGRLENQAVVERYEVGLPVELLSCRPDVRASMRDMEIAFYVTKDAWLNFFPTLNITGALNLTNIVSGALVPFTVLGELGAGLVAPILNAGRNITTLRGAQTKQEIARIEFDKTLLEAATQVNDALMTFKACDDKMQWYDMQVASLKKARQDTETLMRNSESKTYLDVLAAHNALIEAMFGQIENRAGRLQALTALYAALGGGWQ